MSKEIFQNITKGEWIVADSIGKGTRELAVWGENPRNPICLVSPKEKENETDLANAELICMMHRETVGKGINPESVEPTFVEIEKQVEILVECLKDAPIDFMGTGYDTSKGEKYFEKQERLWEEKWRNAYAAIQEALTSAKL